MPLNGEYAPGTTVWAREQAELYEVSGGTEGIFHNGKPDVLLTSRGARTGKLRKTVVARVEHDGEYAVIASRGGKPSNPAWYFNLVAHPHVELQDGPCRRDYTARLVHGEERELWWERALEAVPWYADYQAKTTREIPVFVLTARST